MEEDEVGEVDFSFDPSDWMVVDEHDDQAEVDDDNSKNESQTRKQTGEMDISKSETKKKEVSKSALDKKDDKNVTGKSKGVSSSTPVVTKVTKPPSSGSAKTSNKTTQKKPSATNTDVKDIPESNPTVKLSNRDAQAKLKKGSSLAAAKTKPEKLPPLSSANASNKTKTETAAAKDIPVKSASAKTPKPTSETSSSTVRSGSASKQKESKSQSLSSKTNTAANVAVKTGVKTSNIKASSGTKGGESSQKTGSTLIDVLSHSNSLSIAKKANSAPLRVDTKAANIGKSQVSATSAKSANVSIQKAQPGEVTKPVSASSESVTDAKSNISAKIVVESVPQSKSHDSSRTNVESVPMSKSNVAARPSISSAKSESDAVSKSDLSSSSPSVSVLQSKATVATPQIKSQVPKETVTASPQPVVSSSSKLESSASGKASLASQQVVTNTQSQGKLKSEMSESIADIMESGEDRDDEGGSGSAYDYDMEDISDTEFSDMIGEMSGTQAKSEKPNPSGVARETTANRDEPPVKKAKTMAPSTASTTVITTTASATVTPKKAKENVTKKVTKNPSHGGNGSAVPKKSFGAAKPPAAKLKAQPLVTSTPAKQPAGKTKPQTPATTVVTTPKRIIRRFHRTTQTVPKKYEDKLLQCLIRIPALDAKSKPKSSIAVQAGVEGLKQKVLYKKELPETVRPEVFETVSSFDVTRSYDRSIASENFDYGISLGHVTSGDVEKTLFRENILTKADYYNLCLDRKDIGVVDLFFTDEEKFTTVATNIRKTRVGPRHLVVTYAMKMKSDSKCPLSVIKATVIYDQNVASTNFLAHLKAPVWNKPKVEESVTIHNIPGGIPLDFLKLLIPDAITIELDDDQLQFTQEARRVRLGLNRKTGGDKILKLFTQLYINNEYAVLTQGLTDSFDVPELKEILKQKKKRGAVTVSESSHLREVRAAARDINDVPIVVDSEDEAEEVIMKVENADAVDRILRGRASAWKGPTTAGQLRQALKEETKVTNIPQHSDVNEDLSDISDTSDIGEQSSSQQKTQPKSQGAVRRKTSSTNLTSSRYGDNLSSHTSQLRNKDPDLPPREDKDRRSFEAERDRKGKSKSITSSEGRRGRNRQQASSPAARYSDRFQPLDKSGHSSPSQRSRDRSVHGEKSWQETVEQTDKGKFDRTPKEMGRYETGGVEGYEHERSIIKVPLVSSRDILRRERLELERVERERQERLKKFKPNRAQGMSRSSISPLRSDRKRRRSEEPDFTRQRGIETRDRHGKFIVQPAVNKTVSGRHDVEDRFDQHGRDYGRRDELSKYNEGDSRRGRISERPGSLERRRGSREREERDERRVIRTRSPLTRHVIRGRSASPRRGSSPSHSHRMARRFSPLSNQSPMRRVTIGRKSTSPRRFPVRGSPLSPISVGDDSEEPGSGLGEGMWLTQPPSAFDTARFQGQRPSSHIQTVAGRAAREDLHKSGPHSAASKNLVAVQTDQQTQRYGNPSRDNAGKEGALSAESRNILQRFVEEMIATSRAQSTFQAAMAKELSSNFSPGLNDPFRLLEKIKDMYNTQAQTSNTRTVGSYSSGAEGFSSGRLNTKQAFSHEDTAPRSGVPIQAGRSDTIPSFERNLPPPIPPPVAPPLFTPAATSQDRISQMEALAKQLAADIEKQQTHPPPASQGVWSVPPPATMPPHMMGPPPNMRAPGSIPHGGPVPYPNMPGQPQMRPPNIPPSQDRGPIPQMWPPAPRSNFF